MPISFQIDTEANVLTTSVSGTVTVQDFTAYYAELRSAEQLEEEFRSLVDLTAVVSLDLNVTGVHAIAAMSDQFSESVREGREAIVVTSPDTAGLATIYKESRQFSDRVGIFKCANCARAWLDEVASTPENESPDSF